MRFFKMSTYEYETADLYRYLKEGFDPGAYPYQLLGFLDYMGIEYDHDKEDYEVMDDWLQSASPDDIQQFQDYVQAEPSYGNDPMAPATEHLMFPKIAKPQWLVHFSDNTDDIVKNGFTHGHRDFYGLGLTTYYTDEYRHREPGYNFALDAQSRVARQVAADGKYGGDAVVFWGGGVEAYHNGDEEDQIIFWGPGIKTDMIFPISRSQEDWRADDASGRTRKEGSFSEVVQWVVDNYRMLQQIRNARHSGSISKNDWYRCSQSDKNTNKHLRPSGGVEQGDVAPGKKLGPEWVYHHIKPEDVAIIEREGMQGGSFTPKPGFRFTYGDTWLAVRKSDLMNTQEHQYGKVVAIEPDWSVDKETGNALNTIPPERIMLVDNRGRVIRPLCSSPLRPDDRLQGLPQMPTAGAKQKMLETCPGNSQFSIKGFEELR